MGVSGCRPVRVHASQGDPEGTRTRVRDALARHLVVNTWTRRTETPWLAPLERADVSRVRLIGGHHVPLLAAIQRPSPYLAPHLEAILFCRSHSAQPIPTRRCWVVEVYWGGCSRLSLSFAWTLFRRGSAAYIPRFFRVLYLPIGDTARCTIPSSFIVVCCLFLLLFIPTVCTLPVVPLVILFVPSVSPCTFYACSFWFLSSCSYMI